MITFLTYLTDFLHTIFDIEIINGIKLITILMYNLFIICMWTAFVRRG